MTYPILVPSKGRAATATTPKILDGQCTLFVEPQDRAEYVARWQNTAIVELPANDQGIVYVRQYMLEWARKKGLAWIWVLDDNLRGLGRVKNRRIQKGDAKTILWEAEAAQTFAARVGLIGLQYQQYAWATTRLYDFNRLTACCILIRTDTGINYRYGTDTKEDVDFCLLHLTQGWASVLWSSLAMCKPVIAGRKRGGLEQAYRAGEDIAASRHLVSLWPGICRLARKRGRLDIRVNWKVIDALWGGGS